MTRAADFLNLLQAELVNPNSGWSIGSLGAIAEFHQADGERLLVDDPEHLTRATPRGAIRLTLPQAAIPVAYETLSPRPDRWMQAIAICLPAGDAAVERISTLAALGPDQEAIREEERGAQLFDIGLDQPQLRFCVRTADPALISLLRSQCGRPLWADGNPAMPAILAAHPHRVVLSKLGRIEVYQKIGGPDTGGVSPEGPHTHLLPKLLRTGRTHSANTPIPEGFLPCACLHPENPVVDPLGRDRAFDTQSFESFQAFLRAWGPADYVAIKDAVWKALDAGAPPESFRPPNTRLGRAALRNALRQSARIARHEDDRQRLEVIERWREHFDRQAGAASAGPDSAGD